jgi:ketosteroid isomerase-like protein
MKKLLPFCAVLLLAFTTPTFAQDAEVDAVNALLAHLETVFANGDIEGAMTAFTDDAIIFPANDADIVGAAAIRATYSGLMNQFNVGLSFATEEVDVVDDMAYERGMFTLKLTDKASGQLVAETTNRHVHIFKRQADGSWKTWRMMTNSPTPASTP